MTRYKGRMDVNHLNSPPVARSTAKCRKPLVVIVMQQNPVWTKNVLGVLTASRPRVA